MTDDPRSHQYSDADWEYEIDSAQRQGTTGQTRNRRHGKVSCPSAEEDKDEPNEDEERYDRFGIPNNV